MDLIHDHATHPSLCLCFRIDRIKTMSHGISGGKEVIKFADRGLFILSKQDDNLIVITKNVQFEFRQDLYYSLL